MLTHIKAAAKLIIAGTLSITENALFFVSAATFRREEILTKRK
jgi:hypothetical protein